jgi:cytochrome c553
MTPQAFSELALRLGAVQAKPILDSIEFRVADRTFATLGWPGTGWVVVRLSITDQQAALAACRACHPEPGPRGKAGVTLVRLGGVDAVVMAKILADAWREAYRRQPGAAAGAAAREDLAADKIA